MACHSPNGWIYLNLFIVSTFLCNTLAAAGGMTPGSKIRAVNLGGWLLTEGWIKPTLFDGIPNKDFLDGTQLQFKSMTTGKYICAEGGGGSIIVANRTSASGWETFKLWRVDESSFQFLVFNRQFVGLDNQGGGVGVVAVASKPGSSETFGIIRKPNDPCRLSNDPCQVRIRAPNGLFLQAKTEVSVTADSSGGGSWGNDDPSVFLMKIAGTMKGEFQVTNGYGQDRAGPIMRAHWNSFIVEEDFRYMKEKGLNAVRIPVGWWIASDTSPPWPFIGGSLQALDNAFSWADKYGLGVIIDLHAAPGAQNADEHGGSRDGFQNWGTTEANIQQTVGVIDFLAARYAGRQSLLAVELMNEPRAPGITRDTLVKYYTAGYNAVRRHTSEAYVIMSNRIGQVDPKELLSFAGGLQKTVVDVHYYNLFSSNFDTMTAQQNIDYVNNNHSSALNSLNTANGPLIFVGEWVVEWRVNGATKEDYQRFAKAQLDVFGTASFGWAYWTFQNVNNHWSLRWMLDNGYVSL